MNPYEEYKELKDKFDSFDNTIIYVSWIAGVVCVGFSIALANWVIMVASFVFMVIFIIKSSERSKLNDNANELLQKHGLEYLEKTYGREKT